MKCLLTILEVTFERIPKIKPSVEKRDTSGYRTVSKPFSKEPFFKVSQENIHYKKCPTRGNKVK